jgi:hypothetical protein
VVTRRRAGRPRGASKLGCLVSLLLFVGALYYGSQVGRVYWRYYALVDAMERSARFAATTSDQAIRRTLVAKIDELGLPPEAKRLTVRRGGPPMIIRIQTTYRERLPLPPPLRARSIVFHPSVENRF